MNNKDNIAEILHRTLRESLTFLNALDDTPPNIKTDKVFDDKLPTEGLGFDLTLDKFKEEYGDLISACSGPRYFGLVVGGATPASVAGDWLTTVYDQVTPATEVSVAHESATINIVKELFSLPDVFTGSFVSGGSMSNTANLSIARQWYGLQKNVDIAKEGIYGLGKMQILSASAHSSCYKALSMIGIGRDSLIQIDTITDREAIDIDSLEKKLIELKKQDEPCIIIANAGTVNTTDFDDFVAIGTLKKKYNFWLHIDATFGGFASCSSKYAHLLDGWEAADSITIDAHKWMNVPYDCAFQFTRHIDLQLQVYQNGNAPYVDILGKQSLINLTPQASRRWRSLATWFSLMAYGKEGYKELIERNCRQAKILGDFIEDSECFKLAAPVNLNTVCFNLTDNQDMTTAAFFEKLNASNKVFLTPTQYQDEFYIRCAICNWKTSLLDIEMLIELMTNIISKQKQYL